MDTVTGRARGDTVLEVGEGGDYARGIHTARILASFIPADVPSSHMLLGGLIRGTGERDRAMLRE